MSSATQTTQDCILGALVGAIVGDAAGVTLEFHIGEITHKHVTKAMHMSGGGRYNVAPGQPSDDSELILAMAAALQEYNKFDLDNIAHAYQDWYISDPFDIGRTCATAFSCDSETNLATCMQAKSESLNSNSEANGALMRVIPIPTFFYKRPYTEIAAYARLDASLSHPNPICQDVNALYSVAVAYLINNPGDNIGAIKLLESWPKIHPRVARWIRKSKEPISTYRCDDNMGHVKHAFMLALHFLRNNTSYEEAIRQTISLSYTDTDTNACIVGGLIGALHGYMSIPTYMKEPVLNFDPTKIDPHKSLLGRPRPVAYKPANILDFFKVI